MSETINCDNCVSACCRANTAIPLSKGEAKQLFDAGTDMFVLPKNEWQGNRPGRTSSREKRLFYVMQSDCGNLTQDPETGRSICGDYENRPDACIEFTAGDISCKSMRNKQMPEPAPVQVELRER